MNSKRKQFFKGLLIGLLLLITFFVIFIMFGFPNGFDDGSASYPLIIIMGLVYASLCVFFWLRGKNRALFYGFISAVAVFALIFGACTFTWIYTL